MKLRNEQIEALAAVGGIQECRGPEKKLDLATLVRVADEIRKTVASWPTRIPLLVAPENAAVVTLVQAEFQRMIVQLLDEAEKTRANTSESAASRQPIVDVTRGLSEADAMRLVGTPMALENIKSTGFPTTLANGALLSAIPGSMPTRFALSGTPQQVDTAFDHSGGL